MLVRYIDINDLKTDYQYYNYANVPAGRYVAPITINQFDLVREYQHLLILNRHKYNLELDPRIPKEDQNQILSLIFIATGSTKAEIWKKVGYNENIIIVSDPDFIFFSDPNERFKLPTVLPEILDEPVIIPQQILTPAELLTPVLTEPVVLTTPPVLISNILPASTINLAVNYLPYIITGAVMILVLLIFRR